MSRLNTFTYLQMPRLVLLRILSSLTNQLRSRKVINLQKRCLLFHDNRNQQKSLFYQPRTFKLNYGYILKAYIPTGHMRTSYVFAAFPKLPDSFPHARRIGYTLCKDYHVFYFHVHSCLFWFFPGLKFISIIIKYGKLQKMTPK